MNRSLRYASIGSTSPARASWVTDRLRAALGGSGPAFGPIATPNDVRHGEPDADPDLDLDPGRGSDRRLSYSDRRPDPSGVAWLPDDGTCVPDEVALVVRTSGSTGAARGVMLDRAALLASAHATHDRLAGPGQWVLALPLAHIAGLQVLVRSLLARTEVVVVNAAAGFDPVALAGAVAAASRTAVAADQPLYTSLVPTQLHRLVAAAHPSGQGRHEGNRDDVQGPNRLPPALAPLRRLDAILLGGAAAPPDLIDRARALGLRVVTTYGMTETCGGCVYDGVPLDGVRIDVADGRVHLAGPMVARGYLDVAAQDCTAFARGDDGTRWLRTPDLGRLDGGVLHVLGRADDVLVTGGQKVAPAAVEAVLAAVPGVGQVCLVGVPDAEWGQLVTAVVVASPTGPGPASGPSLEQLREAVSRTLGPAAAPRRLLMVDALPERGPGKVDRAAVTHFAAERDADPSAGPAHQPKENQDNGHTG